jgi:hypothetical protein
MQYGNEIASRLIDQATQTLISVRSQPHLHSAATGLSVSLRARIARWGQGHYRRPPLGQEPTEPHNLTILSPPREGASIPPNA